MPFERVSEFFEPMKKLFILAIVMVGCGLLWRLAREPDAGDTSSSANEIATSQAIAPEQDDDNSGSEQPTIATVLEMATESLGMMESNLDDYTARFVKQELDADGVLGEATEIFLKAQTRFGGPHNRSPRRVYLKFNLPAAVQGREVIWGEGLYAGKMAVHEVGFILGLKTIWLDPNGMLAMQGQRFPISDIGLVKLVEKLIERGQADRDNPDVRVAIDDSFLFDEIPTRRIQVRHAEPSGAKDDFSLAEIVVDPDRQLVLSYRAFGWPTSDGGQAPLLESYAYHDLKTNVGLSDVDFQTTNPEYQFPKF